MSKNLIKICSLIIFCFLIVLPKNINAATLQLESGMTYNHLDGKQYPNSPTHQILAKNTKVIMYYDLGKVKETQVKNKVKSVVNKLNKYAISGGEYLRFTTTKPTKVAKNTKVQTVMVKVVSNGSQTLCKSATAIGCANLMNLELVKRYYVNTTQKDKGYDSVITFHEILHTIGISHSPQKTKGTSMTPAVGKLTHINYEKVFSKDVELIKHLASRTTKKTTYNKNKTSRTIEYKKQAKQVVTAKYTEKKIKGKWIRIKKETRQYKNVAKKQLNTIISYNYNASKKMTSKEKNFYKGSNTLYKKIKFTYNNKGKTTKRYEYIYNKKVQLKSNKNGESFRYTTSYNKNGKYIKTTKQKYNAKGKLGKNINVKKRTSFS